MKAQGPPAGSCGSPGREDASLLVAVGMWLKAMRGSKHAEKQDEVVVQAVKGVRGLPVFALALHQPDAEVTENLVGAAMSGPHFAGSGAWCRR